MGLPQPHWPLFPLSRPLRTVESPMIQKVGSLGSIAGAVEGRVCPRLAAADESNSAANVKHAGTLRIGAVLLRMVTFYRVDATHATVPRGYVKPQQKCRVA
jgi:hypothetical protein